MDDATSDAMNEHWANVYVDPNAMEVEVPDEFDLPDGVWLVINEGGRRYELPIHLPRLGGDEVATTIRGMDAKAMWQRALSGADMSTDPVDVFIEQIAAMFD